MRILVALLLLFLVGCDSKVQKQSSSNFDKVMHDKKRFRELKNEDPSISEQLIREINSQSDSSKERKSFNFK